MADRRGPSSIRSMTRGTDHIVIAGGGVGALEAVLALQTTLGARARIELIAPATEYVHRPVSVAEPFTGVPPQRYDLAAFAAARGVTLRQDSVTAVDTAAQRVETASGKPVAYDHLVLALGARPVPMIPGAITFRGPGDAGRIRSMLFDLDTGRAARIAFVVPGGTTWSLPLYELALQTALHLRERGLERQIVIVTPERMPLAAFGPEASARVAELLDEHDIAVRTGSIAESVIGGRLWMPLEGSFPVDLAVALPALVGPRLPGLPADHSGFIPVDTVCRAEWQDRVYVVGDAAAHAVKQGGLAVQQAGVAAAAITATIEGRNPDEPYRPVLRGMLLTGGRPLYLRREIGDAGLNAVSEEPLWWPPDKIAGGHLGAFLASRPDLQMHPEGALA
jgi:sulfide:quinone oxidoreductase